MMSDSFDNLLARTQHRDTTPPGSSCPDADVLAAYLDATLTSPERAGVEAHAADCARCALQLATLVRLEDVSGSPQQAPPTRWWPRLAWMVPAATAVLVGAIYVGLPTRDWPKAPSPPQRATFEDRAELKETEAAGSRAERDSFAAPRPPQPSMSMPRPLAKSIPPPAPGPAQRRSGATSQNQASDVSLSDQAASQDGGITARQFERKDEAQAPAAEPAGAAAAHESVAEPRTEGFAQLGVDKRADVRPPLVVRSPDARVRWRIVEARIERSTDDGRTWLAERTPAAEAITMAAAASADVCWVAAASGQVLRRGEDGTWMDVSPAPRLSINRLHVTGSLEATVVGADGIAVKTSDGGRTWMR